VTIRIQREGDPYFTQSEYEVTIPEDRRVGTEIIDLNAVNPRAGVSNINSA